MSMSDRVAVMRDGRFEQLGPPEEIFQKPRTRFTADFMGASNILSGKIEESVTGSDSGETDPTVNLSLESGLRIVSQNNSNAAPGDSVWFSIRPEDIYVRGAGDSLETDNRFEGKIIEKVYLGDVTELDIDLGGDVRIVCRIESRKSQRLGLRKEDTVLVGWDAEDCNLLDE